MLMSLTVTPDDWARSWSRSWMFMFLPSKGKAWSSSETSVGWDFKSAANFCRLARLSATWLWVCLTWSNSFCFASTSAFLGRTTNQVSKPQIKIKSATSKSELRERVCPGILKETLFEIFESILLFGRIILYELGIKLHGNGKLDGGAVLARDFAQAANLDAVKIFVEVGLVKNLHVLSQILKRWHAGRQTDAASVHTHA